MTIAKHAIPNLSQVQNWYRNLSQPNDPSRYPVMVRSYVPGADEWKFQIGYIVTHMEVQDYCQMHGLTLVEAYQGITDALPGEVTELF